MRRVTMAGCVVGGVLAVSGCGNPGGLSDAEYIAKLRNEREDYDRKWEQARFNVEAKIAIEQARQREASGR